MRSFTKNTVVILASLRFLNCGPGEDPRLSPSLSLVQEYIARDSRGEFRRVNQWYSEHTHFVGLLPGWDVADVIVDAVPSSPGMRGDTVIIPVRYSRVGIVYGNGLGGTVLEFQDSVVVTEFKVLDLGQQGLRIVEPLQRPHFSVEYMLDFSTISNDQRSRLIQAQAKKKS
jgi:hypothetical protein